MVASRTLSKIYLPRSGLGYSKMAGLLLALSGLTLLKTCIKT